MDSEIKAQANLLTEQGAAEYLAVSVKTLQGWRWKGEGPKFLKLGRAVRYRRADLDSYIEAAMRSSTSDTGEVI